MSDAPLSPRPRREDAGRNGLGSEGSPFGSLYDPEIIEAVLFAGAMEEEVCEEKREERPEGGSDPGDPRSGRDEDG